MLQRTPECKYCKQLVKKEEKGLKNFYKDITKVRSVCEICWKRVNIESLINPLTCFAHILPKWQYKNYREDKNNIAFVCSEKCHLKVDSLIKNKRQQIQKWLDDGRSDIIKLLKWN